MQFGKCEMSKFSSLGINAYEQADSNNYNYYILPGMMWILQKNCSARRRKKLDHLPVLFENKKSDNHIIFSEATKGTN